MNKGWRKGQEKAYQRRKGLINFRTSAKNPLEFSRALASHFTLRNF
jgi:hypothetical protein